MYRIFRVWLRKNIRKFYNTMRGPVVGSVATSTCTGARGMVEQGGGELPTTYSKYCWNGSLLYLYAYHLVPATALIANSVLVISHFVGVYFTLLINNWISISNS